MPAGYMLFDLQNIALLVQNRWFIHITNQPKIQSRFNFLYRKIEAAGFIVKVQDCIIADASYHFWQPVYN